MQGSTLFARAANVPTAEFGNELAVMDLESGVYIAFNRTAADVWKLLETPQSLEAICEILAPRYRVDRDQCSADVMELLRELLQTGVVEEVPGPPEQLAG